MPTKITYGDGRKCGQCTKKVILVLIAVICIRNLRGLPPSLKTYKLNDVIMNYIKINERNFPVDSDLEMPLLWFLREVIGLTGPKYGCGVAQCGACVVHLEGEAVRSCVTKVKRAIGKEVLTIEGLSADADHPVQEAWRQIDVPQCGYCHSGQMMSAAVLLRECPEPTDQDIDDAMAGNLCRCGTYLRIRKAIHQAAEIQRQRSGKSDAESKLNA